MFPHRRLNIVPATLLITILLFCAFVPVALAQAGDQPDLQMIGRIRQEGFHNSKVMETMSELSDRLGQRLTGSKNLKNANEWARKQLEDWGLSNAHLEPFDFGRGWQLDSVTVRMTAPDVAMLYALPKAWTPSTSGALTGEVVRMRATRSEDLEKYRGKIGGKIVLIGEMRGVKPQDKAPLERYDEKRLAELAEYSIPSEVLSDPVGHVFTREELMQRFAFRRDLQKFLADEKPACTIEASSGEAGLIFVQGTDNYHQGDPDGFPQLVMAVEHFGRIARLLDRKVPVTLEINLQSHFESPDDGKAFNTIAEIPGTDKADEIVMTGAHLDSWHAGTGATDDGAGVGITMEALRILAALGVKPRRTIRIGLWGGEEEGLLGSRAYVKEHFGYNEEVKSDPNNPMPSYMRPPGPLVIKPGQAKVAAYFNIDNGTGKLRGIYTQENAAVAPLFEKWGEPFRDLDFTTITERNTGGTDHLSFDAVGIPGFQFIQDPVEYMSRTHHSNMDVYERLQREDMMQAAVILAAFLWDAANRDEPLPRKPLPKTARMEAPATPAAPATTPKHQPKPGKPQTPAAPAVH